MAMFQGFKAEAGDLFWELCFNNDRTWFYEHKEQYEQLIGTPLKELAKETVSILTGRFPEFDAVTHVSRIWRDARRLYGRGPLKDNLWFSVRNGSSDECAVSFYFELKPATFSYGMGSWCTTAGMSENFRRKIDANPAEFERLASEVDALEKFTLEGPMYSRPKGDRGEIVNRWYNRKYNDLCHTEDFGGDLLTPELPAVLADSFTSLMPMFRYLDSAGKQLI